MSYNNNGTVYIMNKFEEFCCEYGIRRKYTVKVFLDIMECLNVQFLCLWIVMEAC